MCIGNKIKFTLQKYIFNTFCSKKPKTLSWDDDSPEAFQKDLVAASKWIEAYPVRPDFKQKNIIEIGCGYGALCIQITQNNAKKVLGVEIDTAAAETARNLTYNQYPEIKSKIEFTDYASIESPEFNEQFDIVVSQNAFEHYEQPEKILEKMAALLKPGGYIYAGFSPIWNSPFGSHLGPICRLPWAHLWTSELLIKKHNRIRPHNPITSYKDIGLNQVSFARHQNMFHKLKGCHVIHFCCNHSIRQRLPIIFYLLKILRALPFLKEYLTVSLHVVIKKDS